MLAFFLHKKFWFPIATIFILALMLELILRLGFGNFMIKPNSLLGEIINRDQAVRDFGLENIDWITLGDSRIDWGINHGSLRQEQQSNGLNHIRMSLPGSGFMAIQATVDWSIDNLSNLKGMVIGLTGFNFTQFNIVDKQTKIAWPFRQYFNYDKYQYNSTNKKPFWHKQLYIFHYFKDIKDYFLNFGHRYQQYKNYKLKLFPNIFDLKRVKSQDLCQYKLSNLKECAASAESIKEQLSTKNTGELFITNQCNKTKLSNKKTSNLGSTNVNSLVANWVKLFESIAENGTEVLFVLLPEHEMISYTLAPIETPDILNQVITALKKLDNVKILDLRNQFPEQQCAYFSDPIHYNTKGSEFITAEILEALN